MQRRIGVRLIAEKVLMSTIAVGLPTLALVALGYEYTVLRQQVTHLIVLQDRYRTHLADSLVVTPSVLSSGDDMCDVVVDDHVVAVPVTPVKKNVLPCAHTKKKRSEKKTQQSGAWSVKNSWVKGLFIWPIDKNSFWLSSLFGLRRMSNGLTRFHYGIDMASPKGTIVRATAAGVVIQAGYVPGYGNLVQLQHGAVYQTRYAHLDSIGVAKNQKVKQGDYIGTVGDTGYTLKRGNDASHLHFEVCRYGKQINPLSLLPS